MYLRLADQYYTLRDIALTINGSSASMHYSRYNTTLDLNLCKKYDCYLKNL